MRTYSFKGSLHTTIFNILKIIQYSKNILKCNIVKNIFKIYKKITFVLKKKNFCIINKIKLVSEAATRGVL